MVAGPTLPVALKLSPGNVGDAPVGRKLIRSLDVKRLSSKFILMNRAYESDETRRTARDVGLKPVVPPKRNRRNSWRYNKNFTNAATKSSVSFVALLKISDVSRRVAISSTLCFRRF
ncbi:MAG: transposase [Thermoguttaceae bacterium]|nr:transposase [Thermoguttaceae bacterium]